jgi:membrane-associated protease RseP (regulator of RpoE activity)
MHPSVVNIVASFVVSLVLHELGHLLAARACNVAVAEAGLGWGPKLSGFSYKGITYQLRALPLGAYVRINMRELQSRSLARQLFVLLAGIGVNCLLGGLAWGTFFGALNLVLAVVNLFPIYQQDGWKIGMVFFRKVFRRTSPLVEWSFTISAGFVALIALLCFLTIF